MIEQVSTREVYRNRWMILREDETRLPDGSPGLYGVVDKPHGVVVIPQDGDRLCLVEQYRYTVGRRQWEFPSGTMPDLAQAADPRELAAHELREETGLIADTLLDLGRFAVAPGVASQENRYFLATDLSQASIHREHEEQDMRAEWFDRETVEKMMTNGQIADSPTVAGYGLLLLHERKSR